MCLGARLQANLDKNKGGGVGFSEHVLSSLLRLTQSDISNRVFSRIWLGGRDDSHMLEHGLVSILVQAQDCFLKKLPKFGLNAASVITEAAGSFLMRLSHGSGGSLGKPLDGG